MRSKKPPTHTCKTCEKNEITSKQIALLKINQEIIHFTCSHTQARLTSNAPRFSRKNCKNYKGKSSGKETN